MSTTNFSGKPENMLGVTFNGLNPILYEQISLWLLHTTGNELPHHIISLLNNNSNNDYNDYNNDSNNDLAESKTGYSEKNPRSRDENQQQTQPTYNTRY